MNCWIVQGVPHLLRNNNSSSPITLMNVSLTALNYLLPPQVKAKKSSVQRSIKMFIFTVSQFYWDITAFSFQKHKDILH